MSIIGKHLSLEKRQFGPGHAIVMTLAAAAALIAATAPFAATPAGTPLLVHDAAASAADARAAQIARERAAARIRGMRCVPIDGATPGFEPLPTTGDSSAGR